MSNLLIIVLGGCSHDYITREKTPNIIRIAKAGFYKCVKAAIPSVASVNHASILTGNFPAEHGISGNYFYNKENGQQEIVDNQRIQTETVFDLAEKKGLSTALLTAHSDSLKMLGKRLNFAITLDNPENILVRYLDMETPPEPDSAEASKWLLQACYRLLKKNNPGVLYCATNDYIPRNFEPDSKEAADRMKEIDHWIGKIYDLDNSREIYITADHGMSNKNHIINLQEILDAMNFEVRCHPPVKGEAIGDENFREGGMLYLYFNDQETKKRDELINFLEKSSYIDMLLSGKDAAKKFNLPEDQIGDYVVFAAEDCTFGDITGKEVITENFRSCGSIFEREIPLVAANAKEIPEKYRFSRDIVKILKEIQ